VFVLRRLCLSFLLPLFCSQHHQSSARIIVPPGLPIVLVVPSLQHALDVCNDGDTIMLQNDEKVLETIDIVSYVFTFHLLPFVRPIYVCLCVPFMRVANSL
jgi:hypothetical protein